MSGLREPVLIIRDITERPENPNNDTLHLVDTNHDLIVNDVSMLIYGSTAQERMSKVVNPNINRYASSRKVRELRGGKWKEMSKCLFTINLSVILRSLSSFPLLRLNNITI